MHKNQFNKDKINIFLQARSDSKRLPFKSLLPINGIPLVVLCARRLMGKNYRVTVLTSENKSDDYLVTILKKYKVNFFRGSLNNVYDRYLECSKKLNLEDIIIRATADNPFVNHSFINEVLYEFKKFNYDYKGVDHVIQNLPYGMSVEIFKKKLLIKYKNRLSKISKEHVTTFLKKHDNKKVIKSIKLKNNLSKLSCTVDTFEDYKKNFFIFSKFKNPVSVPWKKLIMLLKYYKPIKYNYLKRTKYVIGGAQIGKEYSNFEKLNLKSIINKGIKKSFGNIDTAFNYPRSHEEIFKSQINRDRFNIMTKLNFSNKNISKNYSEAIFYINFYRILISLNLNEINCLLIHNFQDFKKNNRTIFKIFNNLRNLNLIKNYGVSIYYPNELEYLMKNFKNLTIQFPINFVDHRWSKLNIRKLKKSSNSILIGRSIFLRGKLLNKDGYIANKKINNLFKKKLTLIKQKLHIKSNLELCVKFVNSINYLDNLIIGFENYKQIKQIIDIKMKKFSTKNANFILNQFHFLKNKYIDILKLE